MCPTLRADWQSFQFAPGKLVGGQARYDPFGTLSLIMDLLVASSI